MPKLVKLAPHRSADRSPLQQETKKRKRPIGKSHALITSKPLTIGKLTYYTSKLCLFTCKLVWSKIILLNFSKLLLNAMSLMFWWHLILKKKLILLTIWLHAYRCEKCLYSFYCLKNNIFLLEYYYYEVWPELNNFVFIYSEDP